MQSNPYKSYIEDEILTADPVKLVRLLCRGAMEAISDARAKLARGDIRGRSAAITKAIEILGELSRSLDHERGADLSAAMASIYDYAQRRLLAGNHEQADPPLAEAERVLRPLADAWAELEMAAQPHAVPTAATERFRERSAPEEYVPLSCAC